MQKVSFFHNQPNLNHVFFLHLLVHYDQCLQARLEPYSNDITDMNVIVNHEPIQYGDIVSLPFIGK